MTGDDRFEATMLDPFGRGPDARSTSIPSGGGVPPWMAEMLNYCSRCGTELAFGPIEGEDRDRLGCPSCGHIAYVNPRLVVTTIPVTADGDIVLLRRGIDPGRGWWAQPGGPTDDPGFEREDDDSSLEPRIEPNDLTRLHGEVHATEGDDPLVASSTRSGRERHRDVPYADPPGCHVVRHAATPRRTGARAGYSPTYASKTRS